MHPNPIFRKTATARNIRFARQRSFGVLAVNAEEGPLVSHVPFQLREDGSRLEMHLVRSNPIVRLLKEPVGAVIAVSGGDSYVSPDWYGIDDQVPTWNYVAVHLRGMLALSAQEELHGVLERLSADMEQRLAPKRPWTIDKMDAEIYARMQRQIVPVAMRIDDIQGTWKLSQNKTAQVRERAMAGIRDGGFGSETDRIAHLMDALEQEEQQ